MKEVPIYICCICGKNLKEGVVLTASYPTCPGECSFSLEEAVHTALKTLTKGKEPEDFRI